MSVTQRFYYSAYPVLGCYSQFLLLDISRYCLLHNISYTRHIQWQALLAFLLEHSITRHFNYSMFQRSRFENWFRPTCRFHINDSRLYTSVVIDKLRCVGDEIILCAVLQSTRQDSAVDWSGISCWTFYRSSDICQHLLRQQLARSVTLYSG